MLRRMKSHLKLGALSSFLLVDCSDIALLALPSPWRIAKALDVNLHT